MSSFDMWMKLYAENKNKKGFNTSEYIKQQELKSKDSKYGVYT